METTNLQIISQPTVWQKFRSNALSLISLAFVACICILALLGYLITPDNTKFANNQVLEIASQKPGFSSKFLLKPLQISSNDNNIWNLLVYGKDQEYQFIPIDSISVEPHKINAYIAGNKGDTSLSVTYLPADFRLSTFGTNTRAFYQQYVCLRTYYLGTDRFGRDYLSRLIIGARVSMAVGIIAVLISLLIGILLGSVAGYYRGVTDKIIMWIVNVTWSVPTLLMVIALTMVLGRGFWQMFIAIGLTMWVEVARMVRGQVLSLREKDYIEACRAMGFSNLRIIFKHILPNTIGPVVIISAANFASAILIESGLSFLGIGIQPPVPSWGNMIKDHYGYIILDKAYLALLPGIAIMLLTLAFSFIGNGLRDAFDIKSNVSTQ